MSIVAEIGEGEATFVVTPAFGREITLEVIFKKVRVSPHSNRRTHERWVVQGKGASGDGIRQHTSFELAVRSANALARRYERAFSKPVQGRVPRPSGIERGVA